MSLTPLDNPLERLGVLPNGMNWRGAWDVNEQYYLNEVVVAPANQASYILTGKTTLLGGLDPTMNADWTELSAPTTGVVSVLGSTYITIGNTPTNPQIINNGVQTITTNPATGIQDIGTANNPSLVNTGILNLTQGGGIVITGTNTNKTIANDGVIGITAGAGISVSAPPVVGISNTGILSLTAGAGIGITAGQTPTISNNGLTSITAGSGLSSTGGTTPTLTNTQLTKTYALPASGVLTDPTNSYGTGSFSFASFQLPADIVPFSTALLFWENYSITTWSSVPFPPTGGNIIDNRFYFSATQNGDVSTSFFPAQGFVMQSNNSNNIPHPSIPALAHTPTNIANPDYVQLPRVVQITNAQPNQTIYANLQISYPADYIQGITYVAPFLTYLATS